ncbi:MAG: DUF5700 domain-containing putative Zn-dependent protease, partial [Thermoanaerobaculia bacterium]
TDEPEAVLALLDKRAAHEQLTDSDWRKLFATEGYRRLQQREHSMGRSFEDAYFRTFVLSDDLLGKRDELRQTLSEWSKADMTGATNLALAYLPKGAKIKAKVYPVIKPKTNSFVFDTQNDPAIFIYIEPLPREVFEGIMAHELHHIGYASACTASEASELVTWVSAFGEGVATIAAAGGPKNEPRLKSDALAEWHRQMPKLEDNFKAVHTFFERIASGQLKGDEVRKAGMEFFGFVGPWYTVGWHMSAVIEEELGRDALIAAFCDQRRLLATYNRAAE